MPGPFLSLLPNTCIRANERLNQANKYNSLIELLIATIEKTNNLKIIFVMG